MKKNSQKKTTGTPERILPISQKAYTRFRERIIYVTDLFGLESKYMLWLYEEYLCGRRHIKSGGGLACDMTFKMLCDEIDRAIARSSRAREAARKRRTRIQQEQQKQSQQELKEPFAQPQGRKMQPAHPGTKHQHITATQQSVVPDDNTTTARVIADTSCCKLSSFDSPRLKPERAVR